MISNYSIFTNPISRLVFRIWIPGGSGPDPASQDQPGTRDPPSTYKITMGWVLRSIKNADFLIFFWGILKPFKY